MVITKDGTTVTAKILNRSLGTISIYGSRLDEEGGREKENDLLKSDIDCEICSYLYNGLRWYHILYIVRLVAGDGDVGAFQQVALRVQFGGRGGGADVGSFHGGRSLADDEFLAVHDVETCGKGAAGGSPDGRCRLRLPVA